jgi:hypothetical protein
MQRYPYGGHVRFALYLAPAVCLLAGLGAATLLVRRGKNGETQGRPAVVVVVALLALIALSSIARDFVFPYRTQSVQQHRDFARWFWDVNESGGQTLCWETDIDDGRLSPVPHTPVAALYLCNREIYSRRPSEERTSYSDAAAAAATDETRPLRCVRFRSFDPSRKNNICGSEADDKAFAAWLEGMRANYDLVAEQTLELPISNRHQGRRAELLCIDTVTVFEFVPKTTANPLLLP